MLKGQSATKRLSQSSTPSTATSSESHSGQRMESFANGFRDSISTLILRDFLRYILITKPSVFLSLTILKKKGRKEVVTE